MQPPLAHPTRQSLRSNSEESIRFCSEKNSNKRLSGYVLLNKATLHRKWVPQFIVIVEDERGLTGLVKAILRDAGTSVNRQDNLADALPTLQVSLRLRRLFKREGPADHGPKSAVANPGHQLVH